MISHVATCDADNLGDYQTVLTSTHTNCLIQFVKERLAERFVSTEARILRFPLLLSSGYFQKFSKFRLEIFNNFNHLAPPISRQREANSTALVAAVNTSFSPLSTEKIEPSKEPNNTTLSTPSGLR